jgi:hypothetical protein
MKKRPTQPEAELEELAENEEFISRDDIDIITTAVEEETGEATVWVRFANFEDMEDAEEYAEFLQTTLPLLLFETTRLQ